MGIVTCSKLCRMKISLQVNCFCAAMFGAQCHLQSCLGLQTKLCSSVTADAQREFPQIKKTSLQGFWSVVRDFGECWSGLLFFLFKRIYFLGHLLLAFNFPLPSSVRNVIKIVQNTHRPTHTLLMSLLYYQFFKFVFSSLSSEITFIISHLSFQSAVQFISPYDYRNKLS